MITSEFAVAIDFPSLSTRESGAKAREVVLEALTHSPTVVLNFANAHPTPSFADEFVGRLAEELGESEFRTRVQIIAVGAAERPLLQQVITHRIQRAHRESA